MLEITCVDWVIDCLCVWLLREYFDEYSRHTVTHAMSERTNEWVRSERTSKRYRASASAVGIWLANHHHTTTTTTVKSVSATHNRWTTMAIVADARSQPTASIKAKKHGIERRALNETESTKTNNNNDEESSYQKQQHLQQQQLWVDCQRLSAKCLHLATKLPKEMAKAYAI